MSNFNVLENEAELVERARNDNSAFDVLYEHYLPRIYAYIVKRVGQRETAEDIVSITFMKVFCNLNKYTKKECSFSAWIYKIATNNLIDFYRKNGRKKEFGMDEMPDKPDGRELPDDYAEKMLDRKLVQRVLAKLNKNHQKILHYKFFAELDYVEIGEAMNITENNARVLTYRALKVFYKHYQKYE